MALNLKTEIIKAAHKSGVSEAAATSIADLLEADGFIITRENKKNQLRVQPKAEKQD